MKRLLVVLCVLLFAATAALAEIEITEQPESQTVEAGGNVTFTVGASGVGSKTPITWYFTNPETGETTTGRNLESAVKGLKVPKANSLSITLKKVPASMHGWTLHCHIGKKDAGVDSEEVMILIAGEDAPAGESGKKDGTESEEAEEPGEESAETGEEAASGENESPEDSEEPDDGAPEETGEEPETDSSEESGDGEEARDDGGNETGTDGESASGSADPGTIVYPEISGWNAGTQTYQYLQLGTYYYEENGGKRPLLWRILYREGNKLTLITEHVIDAHQMYETDVYYPAGKKKYKNHFNDPYEELGMYFWLNGEMAATIFSESDFSAAIIPHKVKETYKNKPNEADVPDWPDEWTESGGTGQTTRTPEEEAALFPYGKDLFYIMTYGDMMKEWYGFPATFSGNTKENEGEIAVPESGRRKAYATPYAKSKVQYPEWKKLTSLYKLDVVTNYKGMNYGGSSPYWAVKRRKNYYMIGIVGANGHLSWRAMDSVAIGVRPATRVDLSKLKCTGGSGTEKDPWVVRIAE